MLHIEHLTKSYDGKTNALEDVTFSLQPGEFVSLIGCSGAGKSALLRCINRLVEPTKGTVVFGGACVTDASARELRRLRCRMSMVFQHYNLVHRASVIENVLQGRLGYKHAITGALGLFTEAEKQAAVDALAQVGLECCAYVRTDQLSGGQKQRVGIARALVQDPLLILADEPIASLDPRSSHTVMEQLRTASVERTIACLVSLHQVEYAQKFSDRIIGIAEGSIVFDGVPAKLTDDIIARIYGDDSPDGSRAECC